MPVKRKVTTTKKKAVKRTVRKRTVRTTKPAPGKSTTAVSTRTTTTRKRRSYTLAVGRRKSAVARVRLYKEGTGEVLVNGKPMEEYFPVLSQQRTVSMPLELTAKQKEGRITIKVQGGGKSGQADAVRHGIARVLLAVNPDLRPTLKKNGLLKRDARVKERKKYGLKRARRAPQWQKR